MNHKPFPFLAFLGMLALLVVSCGLVSTLTAPTSSPQPTDTAQPSGTPVADTATPQPTLSATGAPSATPALDTATPQPPSPSATGAPSITPSATITLKPSPTPLDLLNVPIEGGDPSQKFYAVLVYPHYLPAASTSLWFRVYAHKPIESKVDGEGIATVDFVFLDSNGNQVYEHLEKTAGYCAFGGGEPDCVVWDFAKNKNTWPDGTALVSGSYTLKVNVTAKDNADMFGETTFEIRLP